MWSSGLPSHFGNHVLWGEIVAGQEEGKKGEKRPAVRKSPNSGTKPLSRANATETGKDRPRPQRGTLSNSGMRSR